VVATKKIVHIDTIGQQIDRLNRHHQDANIEGVIIIVKLKDGSFETGWTGATNFLERIGLVESCKQDMIFAASGLVE